MERPIHALFYMQEMLQLDDISRLTSSVKIQISSFFSLHTSQISFQPFGCLLGELNGSFMFQFIKSASVKKHEVPCWLFIRSLAATPLASLLALVSSHLGAYLSHVLGYCNVLEKMKVQKRRCFVMPKPSSANCTTKAQRKP